jgi:uncharacterized protein involved in exopolysaccharide biosynthesis
MSIIQFLRILWAHRYFVALTTAATALGALIAVILIPPAYEAKTRVMLNTLKPDPVTGTVLQTGNTRTYVATQLALIKDIGVAGTAVDSLGWLNNPEVMESFGATKSKDVDLRRAMAQRIIARTNTDMVPGTNILEIAFRAPTPDDARMMANALREAYVDSTLSVRRQDAARSADWFTQQGEKERDLFAKADAAKTDYERQNGIVMQDNQTDVETARLRALAGQSAGGALVTPSAPLQASNSTIQLASLDAQISQASKTYGPNHPAMVQLRAQRNTLAQVVARDEAASRDTAAAAARAMSASSTALQSALETQTAKVIANRSKIQKLTDLQAEVNLHRDRMEKAFARAADLRQEAAIADSGIATLSEAITPTSPAFPNKPLIFGGSIGMGFVGGLLLSLIYELIRRRVRGSEDLEHVVAPPLLAVIPMGGVAPRPRPVLAAINRVTKPGRRRAAAA